MGGAAILFVKRKLWRAFVMNVLVLGQENVWIKEMKKLCKQDQVYLYEQQEDPQDIRLVVTDFPIEQARKGILSQIPFLVVSREHREEKILAAFDAGAEDYMVYPVSPKIAKVRICRILNQIKKDNGRFMVWRPDIHFTPNEWKIFSYMMAYPQKVFSRNELIETVFPEAYEGYDRNVDNYIKEIRKKLAVASNKSIQIETVYGVGYRLTCS